MRKQERLYLTFAFFFFFSLLIFFLGKTSWLNSVTTVLETITLPARYVIKNIVSFPFSVGSNSELQQLKSENAALLKKLVDKENIIKENNALKDQFQTTSLKTQNLLPAAVIGSPSLFPGVSNPEELVIDKGEREGVKAEQAVVVKDIVVGKIVKVSSHVSVVQLVTNKKSSIAAATSQSGALGVIKGQENEMTLDNVLLLETLSVSDIVVTKGETDANGTGYPPGLIIGKIVSVDKKPSALFQSAKVKSLLDFPKLSTVFVMTGYGK